MCIADKVNDKKSIEVEIEALKDIQESIEDIANERINIIQLDINKLNKELEKVK